MWPALCILLGSGCFTIGPIEVVDEDMPPSLLGATHYGACEVDPDCPPVTVGSKIVYCNDCPLEVTVTEANPVFYVFLDDEEPTELEYFWTLEGAGALNNAESIQPGHSQVSLSEEDNLDGKRLTCLISDAGSDVELSWDLVELE
jgi:hypothetical protein